MKPEKKILTESSCIINLARHFPRDKAPFLINSGFCKKGILCFFHY